MTFSTVFQSSSSAVTSSSASAATPSGRCPSAKPSGDVPAHAAFRTAYSDLADFPEYAVRGDELQCLRAPAEAPAIAAVCQPNADRFPAVRLDCKGC